MGEGGRGFNSTVLIGDGTLQGRMGSYVRGRGIARSFLPGFKQ
jgi:hypothetical protein